MWGELASRDPSLLEPFERFLSGVMAELKQSQHDKEKLETHMKRCGLLSPSFFILTFFLLSLSPLSLSFYLSFLFSFSYTPSLCLEHFLSSFHSFHFRY